MEVTPLHRARERHHESAENIALGMGLMAIFGAALAWLCGSFGPVPPLPLPFTLLGGVFFCFGMMLFTKGFRQLRQWEGLTYGQGECRICSLRAVLGPLGFFTTLAGLFGDIALKSGTGPINWARALTVHLPFLLASAYFAALALMVMALALVSTLAPQRLEAWAAARRRQG